MDKQTVVKHFGSQEKVARALGISQAAVSGWRAVPLLRQLQLERITSGELKATEAATNPGQPAQTGD
jgi:DNA-binding transcriptional regulator YdaS (Cro superfamily)